jgi:hypothetical protein
MLHEYVVGDAAVGEVSRGGYDEVFNLYVLGEVCQARGCALLVGVQGGRCNEEHIQW